MNPEEFVTHLGRERASAILRCRCEESARLAMDAAVRGGFRICEFTLTIPGALRLVGEFAARKDLVIGVGTVLTAAQARDAVAAGARYLVSPVYDPEVVAEAKRLGVAMMPGCFTPTELWNAHRGGAELLKLFPAQSTQWLSQVLAPLPMLKIVPTSGVTLDNCQEFLKAGAFALGFVNCLFDPEDIATNRFDAIERRARDMLAKVKA
jgi:Entner-Doudoroff aldolase